MIKEVDNHVMIEERPSAPKYCHGISILPYQVSGVAALDREGLKYL